MYVCTGWLRCVPSLDIYHMFAYSVCPYTYRGGVRGGTVPELGRNLFCSITLMQVIALNLQYLSCAANLCVLF